MPFKSYRFQLVKELLLSHSFGADPVLEKESQRSNFGLVEVNLISQDKPLVSVGIPTYNRLSALQDALKCFREQTYRNLEIIVSDNCSSDVGVDQYMQTAANDDPRIRYFRQSQNIGILANFEFVLNKANGKYFFWAADDDLCEHRFVEAIVNQMEQDSNIVLCACDVRNIDEHDKPMGIERLESIRPSNDWKQTRRVFFRYPMLNIFFCIYGIYQTKILRMCDLGIIKGWHGLTADGEFPFLAQVSSFGRIVAIPEVLKIYRRHHNSVYHQEVKSINNFDRFMVRLVIGVKLFKLALFDKSDLSTRISFLSSIITSYMSSLHLRNKIGSLLPKKLRQFVKRTLHL